MTYKNAVHDHTIVCYDGICVTTFGEITLLPVFASSNSMYTKEGYIIVIHIQTMGARIRARLIFNDIIAHQPVWHIYIHGFTAHECIPY